MFGGASIWMITTCAFGCDVRTFFTIAVRFCVRSVADNPRSPSLAPVSITITSAVSRSSQSVRRNAPADVSPLRPAFWIFTLYPSESAMCPIWPGHASDGSGRPSPAVRLVPMKRTRVGASIAFRPGSTELPGGRGV